MQRKILMVLPFVLLLMAQTKNIRQEAVSKAVMVRGKKVYDTYCLPCHQADGSGVPGLNPPLTKTKWVLGDKRQLITIVLNGMDETIEVNGEEYSNTMGAHDFLKDQEVSDLLTYVRNSFGNKASAVSVVEVKGVRSRLKK